MMIDWLRKLLSPQRQAPRPSLLNTPVGGDNPQKSTELLGTLKLHSGKLSLGDPQYMPGLTLTGIPRKQMRIQASVWRYSCGTVLVASLSLEFEESALGGEPRKLGEVGIDSSTIVIVDRLDFDHHWQEVGSDRIGVLPLLQDDSLAKLLKKKFNLESVRINGRRAELVEPVSKTLEAEIVDLLKSNPSYSKFPFMHFYIQTNSSFDRINDLDQAWSFMPVGRVHGPLMFVSNTGLSDGTYDVVGEYSGDTLNRLLIEFA